MIKGRKYKQEVAAQKKRDSTASDPKGTRFRSATNVKRTQLKKKGVSIKGKHVVHVGKAAKSGGKKTSVGSAKSNFAGGGRIGNKKGKAAGGRKSKR